jgi:hypothetical protein
MVTSLDKEIGEPSNLNFHLDQTTVNEAFLKPNLLNARSYSHFSIETVSINLRAS